MKIAEIVDSTSDPAFAVDPGGRIVGWNEGATRLLGYEGREILDRTCWDLCGRDVFGNRYCGESCPIREMALGTKAIGRFEVLFRSATTADVAAEVSVVLFGAGDPEEMVLLHLLRPSQEEPLIGRPCRLGARLAADPELTDRLTERQLEVLRRLAEGLCTHEIAELLCISEVTVRNHVENLLRTLRVHSRLQAVCLAHRSGVI